MDGHRDRRSGGLTTDRYVQAVEVKPLRGVGVVHHVTSDLMDPDSEMGKTVFEEYAVGKYGNTLSRGIRYVAEEGLEDSQERPFACQRR